MHITKPRKEVTEMRDLDDEIVPGTESESISMLKSLLHLWGMITLMILVASSYISYLTIRWLISGIIGYLK